MKLSLAITTYNRPDLALKSFEKILDDDRVDDVILVDDASDMENFDRLFEAVKSYPKVELYRNAINIGMGANKRKAVSFARNEWVILFDDDNEISPAYLDAIEEMGNLDQNTFYLPDFAFPTFDYRDLAWETYDKDSIKAHIDSPCWNTCNMCVNRDRYLEVYRHPEEDSAGDTIWMNYLWLAAGGKLCVVPGMKYNHLVHENSGFKKNMGFNMGQVEIIKAKIMAL